ncbi:MAG: radical SAM protein [Deltaproteobacteria bacterium]|nr:radical SAM protein [Deltaproteobacteria bacterium]
MRCSYCYAPPKACAGMSEEVGLRALELGARMNEGSCGVVFFGGEPLLRRPLMERMVARAREMERAGQGRFHFKVTTNGLLLDEDFLDWAVRERVMVAMSFDGVRQAQDRHRRLADGGPTFDLLEEKLQDLLAVKPCASVLSVVNPDTAPYLTESISYLLDLGCRYLLVSLNYAAEWREKDFRVLQRQYRELARRYVDWTRAGRKFYLSPFEVKLSSHINAHCYHRDRCALGQKQISVDPAGNLFPCVQFNKAGPGSRWQIGTVFDGIDEEARARIFAESETEKATCRDCAIRERCNNTCGCLNWQTTGTVNRISPVLCRNEQLLVKTADWIGKTLYRERDPHFINKHYNEAYPVLSALEEKVADGGIA